MGLATIIREHKAREREARLLVLGLDNAGKSTCVARWTGEVGGTPAGNKPSPSMDAIAPTFGFEIKAVRPVHRADRLTAVLWDVGGQRRLRPFWRTFFEDASDGLLYVIDSQDTDRLQEALETLLGQLQDARTLHLAVVANKQDLPGALSVGDIEVQLEQILGSPSVPRNLHWRLFGASARVSSQGLLDAFDWLLDAAAIRYQIPVGSRDE